MVTLSHLLLAISLARVFAAIDKTMSLQNPNDIAENVRVLGRQVKSLAEIIGTLKGKIVSSSPYCDLLPKNTCGGCTCKDDDRLLKRYYCDCQNLPPERDCVAFKEKGNHISGLYKIHQNHMHTIQVFCDQVTDGGGWAVIQRRVDGSIDFYRDWYTYKIGFGNLNKEFWLGNENIFTLTLQGLYPKGSELRVELTGWMGNQRYAKYTYFQVGNEKTKYVLNVGGYSGTAGDSLTYHSTKPFVTYDRDDKYRNAFRWKGSWWYKEERGYMSNLNGRYLHSEDDTKDTAICWYTWYGSHVSYKSVEMKIRRNI